MIVQIQQTAFLILFISYLVIIAEKRDVTVLPEWYVGAVVIPLLSSAVILVVTTLIRIWA